MAEPYLAQLNEILDEIGGPPNPGVILEARHFFSGAALYANQKICASLSPAGLALKLPEDQRNRLCEEEQATEFRFFPSGPVKREYALISEKLVKNPTQLKDLLAVCVRYVLGLPDPNS